MLCLPTVPSKFEIDSRRNPARDLLVFRLAFHKVRNCTYVSYYNLKQRFVIRNGKRLRFAIHNWKLGSLFITQGVLSPKLYVDVLAGPRKLGFLLFAQQLPTHQYTSFERKAPNLAKIGWHTMPLGAISYHTNSYHNLLIIHPICYLGSIYRYTRLCEITLQKAGTYAYSVRTPTREKLGRGALWINLIKWY